MKILVVAPQPFYEERGTPIATRRLVATLASQGHRVDLLAYPLGTEVPVDGVRIHRSPGVPGVGRVPVGPSLRKLLLDVPMTAALAARARPGRYDVIHAVEEAIFPALLLRSLHGARVVYDMDSSLSAQLLDRFRLLRPVARPLRWAERWAIRRADLVLPVSEDLADLVPEGVPRDRVHILRDTPVDSTPGDSCEELRDGWPPGTTLALYVGNLASYQGIDLLVAAAERLDATDRIGIDVIGGAAGALADYRSKVADRGLDDRIRFLGPRPLSELRGYLEQADVLLSPRIHGDNTPLKIYSYMAAGRPIAATRLRTHTQVLDEETAALFDPNPEALVSVLRDLRDDEERRTRLAEAARERVENRYSVRAYEKALRAAYDALAGSPA